MKHNYIDGKGVYHNELNLTLAQIYDSGVEFGCEVTTKGIIEELEKIKTEIQGLSLGYQCLGVIEDRISELKGEQNEQNTK